MFRCVLSCFICEVLSRSWRSWAWRPCSCQPWLPSSTWLWLGPRLWYLVWSWYLSGGTTGDTAHHSLNRSQIVFHKSNWNNFQSRCLSITSVPGWEVETLLRPLQLPQLCLSARSGGILSTCFEVRSISGSRRRPRKNLWPTMTWTSQLRTTRLSSPVMLMQVSRLWRIKHINSIFSPR